MLILRGVRLHYISKNIRKNKEGKQERKQTLKNERMGFAHVRDVKNVNAPT
jgi:hypothetical protein